MGANVSTTYISCPVSPSKTLGIKLPFLVMIIKNVKKYFTFDDQGEAVYLHDAHAAGRRMESDPVQFGGLHAES